MARAQGCYVIECALAIREQGNVFRFVGFHAPGIVHPSTEIVN